MTPGEHGPPLLEITRLTVRHGSETLLSDVSFSVARGRLHALVGPNGAGKTTLLTAVLGQAPFTGRIVAYWQQSGRIGYVPQAFHVDRTLPVTVADFLAITRQQRPVCFGLTAAARQRISRLLAHVGLAGFEGRLLSVLSGGELRRVRWWVAESAAEVAGDRQMALRERVGEAVRQRLRADVPLALSLSGGVDSAVIAAACVRQGAAIEAFTMRFDGEGS